MKTEKCVHCASSVKITYEHTVYGDGPWCACCSVIICSKCWLAAGSKCTLCSPQATQRTRRQYASYIKHHR